MQSPSLTDPHHACTYADSELCPNLHHHASTHIHPPKHAHTHSESCPNLPLSTSLTTHVHPSASEHAHTHTVSHARTASLTITYYVSTHAGPHTHMSPASMHAHPPIRTPITTTSHHTHVTTTVIFFHHAHKPTSMDMTTPPRVVKFVQYIV